MTTFNQWLLRWLNGASLLMVVLVMVVAGGAFAGWWPWPQHALVVGVAGFMLWMLALLWVRWLRERQVREAPLPQFLKRKLREIYPHLSGKEADLVERGLRQFFMACLRSKKKFVAMLNCTLPMVLCTVPLILAEPIPRVQRVMVMAQAITVTLATGVAVPINF